MKQEIKNIIAVIRAIFSQAPTPVYVPVRIRRHRRPRP